VRFALTNTQFYFNEFVVLKSALQLLQQTFRYTGRTDQDGRLHVVSQLPKVLFLFFCQWHGRHYSGADWQLYGKVLLMAFRNG
jgi:hypothetical protein